MLIEAGDGEEQFCAGKLVGRNAWVTGGVSLKMSIALTVLPLTEVCPSSQA